MVAHRADDANRRVLRNQTVKSPQSGPTSRQIGRVAKQ